MCSHSALALHLAHEMTDGGLELLGGQQAIVVLVVDHENLQRLAHLHFPAQQIAQERNERVNIGALRYLPPPLELRVLVAAAAVGAVCTHRVHILERAVSKHTTAHVLYATERLEVGVAPQYAQHDATAADSALECSV